MTKLFDRLIDKAKKTGVAQHKVLAKNVMGYHSSSARARENEHLIQWRLVIGGDSNMVYLYHYGTLIFYYNTWQKHFYYYGIGTTDTRYLNLISDYCNLDIAFRTKMDEGTYLDLKQSNLDDGLHLMSDEQARELPHYMRRGELECLK